MSMAKRYRMSIHDMNRKKLWELYDSEMEADGEAREVVISKERSGWKQIEFSIDRYLNNGTVNPRCSYIRNDFQVRLTENGKSDWYTIVAPTDIHDGNVLSYDVLCEHISGG